MSSSRQPRIGDLLVRPASLVSPGWTVIPEQDVCWKVFTAGDPEPDESTTVLDSNAPPYYMGLTDAAQPLANYHHTPGDDHYTVTESVSVTALVAAYERALGDGETTVVVGDLVVPTAQLYDWLADPTTYIASPSGRYVPTPPPAEGID